METKDRPDRVTWEDLASEDVRHRDEAFQRLWNHHGHKFLRKAERLLGRQSGRMAEEVVQESVLVIWERAQDPSGSIKSPPYVYGLGVVGNKAHEAFRASKRLQTESQLCGGSAVGGVADDETPSVVAVRREHRAGMRRALQCYYEEVCMELAVESNSVAMEILLIELRMSPEESSPAAFRELTGLKSYQVTRLRNTSFERIERHVSRECRTDINYGDVDRREPLGAGLISEYWQELEVGCIGLRPEGAVVSESNRRGIELLRERHRTTCPLCAAAPLGEAEIARMSQFVLDSIRGNSAIS